MFSQYSWGDFFKFVAVLAFFYYAFVGWKYYRQEIWDWISNRGKSLTSPPVNDENEEDEIDSPLFTVNHYEDDQPKVASQSPAQPMPTEWLPPAAQSSNAVKPVQKPAIQETSQDEIDLQGPAVAEPTEESLSMPVMLQAENLQELSLDMIISAANRIAPDEHGVLVAVDAGDEPAKRVAVVLNNQHGKDAFSDFKFVR